jgi:hypothetical protein
LLDLTRAQQFSGISTLEATRISTGPGMEWVFLRHIAIQTSSSYINYSPSARVTWPAFILIIACLGKVTISCMASLGHRRAAVAI